MVQINFNAATVAPNLVLEPVPTGQYPVMITKSEEKPTKAGTGSYIELEMTIQGGEFNGRKVYDRLNTRNQNQTAVDIAYSTLSAICHVAGVLNLQDTQQLHGRPFTAVVIKKAREDLPGAYSNEVRGYKDINGNDPGQAGQVANAGAQPAWAAGQAPKGAVPQQPVQQAQQPQFQPQQQAQAQVQQQQPVQQTEPQIQQQVQQPAGDPNAAANQPPPWVAQQ